MGGGVPPAHSRRQPPDQPAAPHIHQPPPSRRPQSAPSRPVTPRPTRHPTGPSPRLPPRPGGQSRHAAAPPPLPQAASPPARPAANPAPPLARPAPRSAPPSRKRARPTPKAGHARWSRTDAAGTPRCRTVPCHHWVVAQRQALYRGPCRRCGIPSPPPRRLFGTVPPPGRSPVAGCAGGAAMLAPWRAGIARARLVKRLVLATRRAGRPRHAGTKRHATWHGAVGRDGCGDGGCPGQGVRFDERGQVPMQRGDGGGTAGVDVGSGGLGFDGSVAPTPPSALVRSAAQARQRRRGESDKNSLQQPATGYDPVVVRCGLAWGRSDGVCWAAPSATRRTAHKLAAKVERGGGWTVLMAIDAVHQVGQDWRSWVAEARKRLADDANRRRARCILRVASVADFVRWDRAPGDSWWGFSACAASVNLAGGRVKTPCRACHRALVLVGQVVGRCARHTLTRVAARPALVRFAALARRAGEVTMVRRRQSPGRCASLLPSSAGLTVPVAPPISRPSHPPPGPCHENSQQPEVRQGARQELPGGAPPRPGLRDQQEEPADEVPPGLIRRGSALDRLPSPRRPGPACLPPCPAARPIGAAREARMIRLPDPKPDVLARRDAIVAGLRRAAARRRG